MQPRSPRIGFEGILSDDNKSYIGFEQYEIDQRTSLQPAYPLNDTMPSANQSLHGSSSQFNFPSHSIHSIPPSSTSSRHSSMSQTGTKKSLSFPQLFAIYNEIINEWSQEQWLQFVDDHVETYLTLDLKTKEDSTVQTAIDHFYLKSGTTLLKSQPECLLIRTKSKSKTLVLPNSIISIDNLLENDIPQQSSLQYKILAIICDSNEGNSKLMFYKDKNTNFWYVYYNQSILSPSHSNILSNDEHYKIEAFIQKQNQSSYIDSSQFTPPLSALNNHPIVYVYIPHKNHQSH